LGSTRLWEFASDASSGFLSTLLSALIVDAMFKVQGLCYVKLEEQQQG